MLNILCTYESFEECYEVFEGMNFKANDYVPSFQILYDVILPDLRKYIKYLMWIDETGVARKYS